MTRIASDAVLGEHIMSDNRNPQGFDPKRPEGTYQCPHCYSTKTDVITATELFCYDCRNITDWKDQGNWFLHNGKWYKALTDEEL